SRLRAGGWPRPLDRLPEGGASPCAPPVRQRSFAAIEAVIFLGSPIAVIAPCLKVCLGALGHEHAPRDLKLGARGVKRRRAAAGAFAGAGAGIKATAPFPPRRGARIADALRDRADMHVAVIDAPSLFGAIVVAAAGQGEHAPSSRRSGRR